LGKKTKISTEIKKQSGSHKLFDRLKTSKINPSQSAKVGVTKFARKLDRWRVTKWPGANPPPTWGT